MSAEKVTAFLTYLATDRKVSASTQNQAKSALLFLYPDVLKVELPWLDEVIVREGKDNKDRVTVLPENLLLRLKAH